MFLIILIKSLIIGALVGVGVGAGAARMFHAPTTQGMGAFRTLGELNSCEGDPASHFSFGLGFFFNAWGVVCGGRIVHPGMSITASSLTGARRR
ncbi:Putative inner membrane protein [Salmonella enterica subsp. enterica]|uniref:Inner membrane protein n=1 Tax=Salmonella enterica I TaxID=59201 RepID=A0A447PVF0_SALET|nr:Putative inner membrane protein [Salmonella enterica subsp. enterica]